MLTEIRLKTTFCDTEKHLEFKDLIYEGNGILFILEHF